jgi:hypothetical protein
MPRQNQQLRRQARAPLRHKSTVPSKVNLLLVPPSEQSAAWARGRPVSFSTKRRSRRFVVVCMGAARAAACQRFPAYDPGMRLESASELLLWLEELGTTRAGSGVFTRGEYLISLATGEGRIPEPASLFSDWLYELRGRGLIVFDDSDAPGEVHLIRSIAVTAPGRASVEGHRVHTRNSG